jgi:protein-tyrosine phosphatase
MEDIFWIQGDPPAPLAVVICPSGDDWLEDDLLRMKQAGIQTLVSLLEASEGIVLGLEDEGPEAVFVGMNFLSFPMPDKHVPPDTAAFREFVIGLANRLSEGESIGIHCRGSIGRSTVTAACALLHLGWQPKAALAAIEKARGFPVPDTKEQKAWILSYKTEP